MKPSAPYLRRSDSPSLGNTVAFVSANIQTSTSENRPFWSAPSCRGRRKVGSEVFRGLVTNISLLEEYSFKSNDQSQQLFIQTYMWWVSIGPYFRFINTSCSSWARKASASTMLLVTFERAPVLASRDGGLDAWLSSAAKGSLGR